MPPSNLYTLVHVVVSFVTSDLSKLTYVRWTAHVFIEKACYRRRCYTANYYKWIYNNTYWRNKNLLVHSEYIRESSLSSRFTSLSVCFCLTHGDHYSRSLDYRAFVQPYHTLMQCLYRGFGLLFVFSAHCVICLDSKRMKERSHVHVMPVLSRSLPEDFIQ